jgi:hypothetical protein
MDASGISTQVPRNGALVVNLACSSSRSCTGDPLATVGSVLDPSGKQVAGRWTLRARDVVVFVPNSPFDVGAGYKVQFKSSSANERSFDVVAAIEAPKPDAFEAALLLSTVFTGATGSYTCCTTDSCGSGCYYAKQQELAQLSLHFSRTPNVSLLGQLELRAVSSDKGELVSSCVGCIKLPELLDHEARDEYCVELSARVLGTGAEIALGRVCAAAGRASLATQDIPMGEIPTACRVGGDASVPNGAGQDAAIDASTGYYGDAGADQRADVQTAATTGLPPGVSGPDQVDEGDEPSSSSGGCSATRRDAGDSGSLALLVLLGCLRVRRRRTR